MRCVSPVAMDHVDNSLVIPALGLAVHSCLVPMCAGPKPYMSGSNGLYIGQNGNSPHSRLGSQVWPIAMGHIDIQFP